MAADASSYRIGAVVSHIYPDGSERPIAFTSRTLSKSERNYAQLEKEALSLVYGVWHFHRYLYGRCFTLVTDHKPILSPRKGIPSLAAARLQRWAIILSAYQYQIEYKCTKDHGNADSLSRLPIPTVEALLFMSSQWHNWAHYQLLQSSLENTLDKIHCWVKSNVSPNLVGPKKWRIASSPTGTGDMNSLLKVTVSCGAYKWLCQRSCRMRCWGSFIESTKALLGWKQLREVMCGGLVWTSCQELPNVQVSQESHAGKWELW